MALQRFHLLLIIGLMILVNLMFCWISSTRITAKLEDVSISHNNQTVESLPINQLYTSTNFLPSSVSADLTQGKAIGLLVMVKSARYNFEKREAIRRTWGSSTYLRKITDLYGQPVQILFISGIPESPDASKEDEIIKESELKNDIILADFVDSYRNNTYKSILAFRWALKVLSSDFHYMALVDDDIFVNVSNVMDFLKRIPHIKVFERLFSPTNSSYLSQYSLPRDALIDPSTVKDLSKLPLYTGSIFRGSKVVRRRKSKSYVSKIDYAQDMFPAYISGAGVLMDRKTVDKFYVASQYIKHLQIDDAYIGILADKTGILPLENPNFRIDYTITNVNSQEVPGWFILHGFKCPVQLIQFWETGSLINLSQKCQNSFHFKNKKHFS